MGIVKQITTKFFCCHAVSILLGYGVSSTSGILFHIQARRASSLTDSYGMAIVRNAERQLKILYISSNSVFLPLQNLT